MIESSRLSRAQSPIIDSQDSLELRRDKAFDAVADQQPSFSPSTPEENYSTAIDSSQDLTDPSLKRLSSMKNSPSNAMPPRNPPLSWQRRPNSQASDRPRSRPLSMVATENAARSPRATPEPSLPPAAEPTLSRDQIAQSLASKDPAWFRQSADSRGGSSPAYRKNQVEDEDRSDHGSVSARVKMPGMSRESSNVDQTVENPAHRAASPSRNGVGLGTGSRDLGIGSPIPLNSSQRFEPPNTESSSEARSVAMSPSQGRISPERLDRPISPTKGMGGFVQSAMMKRSDSVSKRWSVQSPPGLNRGNSTASSRGNVDPPSTSYALGSIMNSSGGGSRPSSLSRDGSPRPLSRPTSSHSNATITQDGRPGTGNSMRSTMTTSTNNDGFAKPALPASHSQNPQDIKAGPENTHNGRDSSSRTQTTPPTSPSKTMDPRRWSPTKSSWLESALNKPESPKIKAIPPTQQPAWMSEISKTKQRGSVDLGRSPTITPKHEVNIGGLMRSPPPGGLVKPISIGGVPAGFSSNPSTKSLPDRVSPQNSRLSPSKEESSEALTPASAVTLKSSPLGNKTKPETPPKKDFRANLKPRQLPEDSAKEEPEFKNVFGQLRRTKTQNYVAPDELKNNITRGKAALNVTGGPKKTDRKDEFKDAILQKKEDFKKAQIEGKGVRRSTSGGSQDSPLPEALAKRKVLGRSDSRTGDIPSSTEPAVPETPKSSQPAKESSTLGQHQGKEAIGGKLAGRFNPALAGLLARGPPSMASDTSRSSSPASSQRTVSMSTSTTNADTAEPRPQLTHMTKGRARGPRRKAPSTNLDGEKSLPSDPVQNTMSEETLSQVKQPSLSGPAATSTMGTEREERTGVKASLLNSELSLASPKVPVLVKTPKTTRPVQEISLQADSENPVSQPPSPRKLDLNRRSQFLQEVSNNSNKGEPLLDFSKPLSPTKKANIFEVPVRTGESISDAAPSPKPIFKPATPIKSPSLTSTTNARLSLVSKAETSETSKLGSSPLSPRKTADEPTLPPTDSFSTEPKPATSESESTQPARSTPRGSETSVSVRDAASRWDRPTPPQTSAPRTRSPIKLPTHDDEKAAMVGAGLRSASPVKNQIPVGLGIQTSISQFTREIPSSRPLPTPPPKGPLSPHSGAPISPLTVSAKSSNSPIPQTSEAARLVTDFFGQPPSSPDFVADTATILATRPDEKPSVKTLRSNLYQFSEDGKKQIVPKHQERLLFEGNMYICVHTFANADRKKLTEVYFWIGDEVPTATVSGTEIFAKREAKGAGGDFIKIQQGKETPEFFQALGGIIIIRRGSSNKYDSLAPHILCARKHFGQIAFDEVDYSASSLCSGFPYLISTQSGRCYLWKGKGSGIDELSCARLIGMDLGLTGEIEEVEEGNEPSSFLQIFGSNSKIPKSADHWRMKPNYSKYCGRLFYADSAAKSQVGLASMLSIYLVLI